MKQKNTEMTVRAIENGTVVDHIPSKNLFKVLSIIGIERMDTTIFIGNNLDSKKLGKKGIIKITDKFPSIDDFNKIALLAPSAVFNIIRNYEVVEKKAVEIPKTVDGIVKCMNPKCITNFEHVTTHFDVSMNEGSLQLKCRYCEKITDERNIEIV
ncbi:MAG: aspartate carbamoyltransferase regulatory subunit [Bacteroidales bacterium]|nr:aspartate carbamoyltransferase regulatory subunit [Bacteroidales bacterium]